MNFKDKEEIAIARIQDFYCETYYEGLSGGKDSDVVDHLLIRSGKKFERHHQHTTLDAPQTVRYIRQKYPDIEIDYPEKSIWRLIVENGTPPTKLMRYCCRELKEYGGEGRFKVLGIRAQESAKRKKNRRRIEICYKNDTRTLNPIIDWSDRDVWEYIKKYGLTYNPLYCMGCKRVGCIMCPQKSRKGMEWDAKMFPKYYQQFLRTFQRMLDERHRKGLETTWQTSEEVMEWWLKICE
jgi:phosphoadenosine phosphosulfate reductase